MAEPLPFFAEDLVRSREQCFELMGYAPVADPRGGEVVRAFHRSPAKYRIVSAPARTSKSYAAAPEAVHDFFPRLKRSKKDGKLYPAHHENLVWLVGTDYDNIKEWDYCFQALVDGELVQKLGGTIESIGNSPRQGNMKIVATFGRTEKGRLVRCIMQGKSAQNERSLQGEEVYTTILSEAADHTQRTWDKYLRTRTKNALFPTTPKRGAMWLYEMIEHGDTDPTLSIEHFEFNRFSNPVYDHERYELARRRAEINYGNWRNDPEFMEQFEGKWTFEGGKVLPFRWTEDDVYPSNVQEHPRWVAYADFAVSMDYGYADACVGLFWALGPEGQVHCASEVYEKKLVPTEFLRRLHARAEFLGVNVKYWVEDPKKPEVGAYLRELGLPVFTRVGKNVLADRAAGYQRLREWLEIDPLTMQPRMTIHPCCTNFVAELKHLRFKEGYNNEFSEAAIVGADHAVDAARYFVSSRPSSSPKDSDAAWYADWMEKQKLVQRYSKLYDRQAVVSVGRNPMAMAGVN